MSDRQVNINIDWSGLLYFAVVVAILYSAACSKRGFCFSMNGNEHCYKIFTQIKKSEGDTLKVQEMSN